MRPLGNTSPSNTRQLALSSLLCGFDGIYIGYYGEVLKDVYNVLSRCGEIPISEMNFKVRWKSQGAYRVVLDNDCLNIRLGNIAPSQYSPSVYVQVKSAFLWSAGLEEMHRQVISIVTDIYGRAPEREQVSRADVFADFVGVKPFQPGDVEKFPTRAKSKVVYYDGARVNGFVIGKGDIQARVYDKTLEIRKSGKTWLYELWGVDQNGQVWRVEFQLRREALKGFRVETFEDLMNTSQALWDYCTSKWLSVRTNARLMSFWKKVQAAKFKAGDNPAQLVKRERMRSGMTEKQAAAQIGGIVESYARSQEIELNSTAFNQLIPHVRERWIR